MDKGIYEILIKLIDSSIIDQLHERSLELSPAFLKENFNALVLLSARRRFHQDLDCLSLHIATLSKNSNVNEKQRILLNTLQLEIETMLKLTNEVRSQVQSMLNKQ